MFQPEDLSDYEAAFEERVATALATNDPQSAETALRSWLVAHALQAEAKFAQDGSEQNVVRSIAAALHPERIDGMSARARRLLFASVQVHAAGPVEPKAVLESLLAQDGSFAHDLSVRITRTKPS